MANTLDWKASDDPRDIVHVVVQALVEGRLVIIPAETTYLVAASALSTQATAALAGLAAAGKVDKPSLLLRSAEEALDFAYPLSKVASRLVHRGWPGPLILELPSGDSGLAERLRESLPSGVFSDGNHLPLRVSAHEAITQTLRLIAGPLLAAPLLFEGRPVSDGQAAARRAEGSVALVVDDGATHFQGLSTSVRVEDNVCKVINSGVLEGENLQRLGQLVILLVCTGNTCRSPMAEAILRSKLQKRFPEYFGGGTPPVFVASAGLSAFPGGPASPEAIAVMKKRGLSLLDHQSRAVTERALRTADLVLTMTDSHRNAIVERMPGLESKVKLLSGSSNNVSDPFGGSESVYAACADQIDGYLDHWVGLVENSWLPQWKVD